MITEVSNNLGQAHSLQKERKNRMELPEKKYFLIHTKHINCSTPVLLGKKPRRMVVNGTAPTTCRKQSRRCIKWLGEMKIKNVFHSLVRAFGNV